jgi:N-acetylglucosaminyl-diphospho-decaprenol L-rhamnosyltransferase
VDVEISFCVVNTNGRELLMRCLDAVRARARELEPRAPSEVLVIDNASDDGSVAGGATRGEQIELIELDERRGKAWCDSELMARSRGRYCLLLNEDSELLPGAAVALHGARLESDPRAACAVASLRRADGSPQASAWRFPSVAAALAGALMLGRR